MLAIGVCLAAPPAQRRKVVSRSASGRTSCAGSRCPASGPASRLTSKRRSPASCAPRSILATTSARRRAGWSGSAGVGSRAADAGGEARRPRSNQRTAVLAEAAAAKGRAGAHAAGPRPFALRRLKTGTRLPGPTSKRPMHFCPGASVRRCRCNAAAVADSQVARHGGVSMRCSLGTIRARSYVVARLKRSTPASGGSGQAAPARWSRWCATAASASSWTCRRTTPPAAGETAVAVQVAASGRTARSQPSLAPGRHAGSQHRSLRLESTGQCRPSCGGNVNEGCSIGDETRSDGPDSALVGASQVPPSSRQPYRAVPVRIADDCAVLSGIAPEVSGAHGHGRKRPRAHASRASAGSRGESGASYAHCSCSRSCGTLPPCRRASPRPMRSRAITPLPLVGHEAQVDADAVAPIASQGRDRRRTNLGSRARRHRKLGRRARLDRARQASRIAFLPSLSLGAQAARGRTHRLVDDDVPGPGVLVRPASRCTIYQRSGLVRSDRRYCARRAATAATKCGANAPSAERRRSTSVQAACAATSPAPRSETAEPRRPAATARPGMVYRAAAQPTPCWSPRSGQEACSPSDAPRYAGETLRLDPLVTLYRDRCDRSLSSIRRDDRSSAGMDAADRQEHASPAVQPAMPRSARRAGTFGPTLAVSAYAGGAGRLAIPVSAGPGDRRADDVAGLVETISGETLGGSASPRPGASSGSGRSGCQSMRDCCRVDGCSRVVAVCTSARAEVSAARAVFAT